MQCMGCHRGMYVRVRSICYFSNGIQDHFPAVPCDKDVCGKYADKSWNSVFPHISNLKEMLRTTRIPSVPKCCLDWPRPYSLDVFAHSPIRVTEHFSPPCLFRKKESIIRRESALSHPFGGSWPALFDLRWNVCVLRMQKYCFPSW